jgi:iron complex transport system substrate-binding protein
MRLPPQDVPQRIVSLAPSATSILFALGARRQVVGVTKWCAEVAPVGRRPRLGDCWSLDASAVARLRPTLIIGSVPYKAEAVERVLDIGAPFLAMNPRSIADVYADIQLLGGITDRRETAAAIIRRMRSAFAAIASRAARRKPRPRVYCEAWPNPRISSPPWVDELVKICGGEPVVPSGQKVSDQDVARARPDVIILAWTATGARAETKRALENPHWRDVPAVLDRRVYAIRDELLNTPAPVLVQGAQELFRLLHSDSVAAPLSRKVAARKARAR